MPISREELRKKGWTEEEIDYTFNVIDTAKDKKSAFIHFLDGTISWFALFIVFLGSLILSVVIMPFFITLGGVALYGTIFVLALVLGIVFNVLIDQINVMGKNEKILGEVILPIISFIDVYVMFGISAVLVETLKLSTPPHNRIIFAATYIVAFSGPFYFSHLKMLYNKYLSVFFRNKKNNSVNDQLHYQNQNSNQNTNQNSNQNMNQNIQSSQDYYQIYLENQKNEEMRKKLYAKRLKDDLLKRINK